MASKYRWRRSLREPSRSSTFSQIKYFLVFLKFCVLRMKIFCMTASAMLILIFVWDQQRMLVAFLDTLQNEWRIGNSGQISYIHALIDLIGFRKLT